MRGKAYTKTLVDTYITLYYNSIDMEIVKGEKDNEIYRGDMY